MYTNISYLTSVLYNWSVRHNFLLVPTKRNFIAAHIREIQKLYSSTKSIFPPLWASSIKLKYNVSSSKIYMLEVIEHNNWTLNLKNDNIWTPFTYEIKTAKHIMDLCSVNFKGSQSPRFFSSSSVFIYFEYAS